MGQAFQACFVGLGSNLETPEQQIFIALKLLKQLPNSRFVKRSSLYTSTPVGPADQPDYVNAVALIETQLSALSLLKQLQTVEVKMGRIKTRRWGERIIDLDILLYGTEGHDSSELTIPHRELLNRDFALMPLLEIAPNHTLPNGQLLSPFLDKCPSNNLQKLVPTDYTR